MKKRKYIFSMFEVVRELTSNKEDYITFILQWKTDHRNKSKKCGQISITPSDMNFIESSSIDSYLRGMGLGYKFYEKVLKEVGYLSSDYAEASDSAKGVWKKLAKNYFYQTNFFEGRITVYNKRTKNGKTS